MFTFVSPAPPVIFDIKTGEKFHIVLTQNVAASQLITGSPFVDATLVFHIQQDAVGGRTFAWPSNVKGGAAISLAPNARTVQMFNWDGATAIALAPAVVTP